MKATLEVTLPWILLLALVVHAGAHLAIAAGFLKRRAFKRAAIALVVPPLAPLWAWKDGMRSRVVAWLAALAVYAIGVAIS